MMNKQSLWTAALISAALISTALAPAPAFAQDNKSALDAATSQPAPDFILSEAPEDRVMGKATAPVTMIVYASVTCPHCGDWFSDEWPDVKKGLVETGKLRVVFRPFPTAPQAISMVGFALAECAEDGKYFEVIEYQMENQDSLLEQAKVGKGREAYSKVATIAGLDGEEGLKACLESEDNIAPIQLSTERAIAGKIQGVPAFLINGDVYSGPQKASALVKLINEMNAQGLSKLPTNLP